MKRLFFITLLLVSFVLFSCKNDLSSDAQGSISFDTGSTADYISRSASQNIIALNASNNSHNENEYISYTIKISISTEGDYEEKVEKEYSKLLKDILNTTDQNQAIVSFIKDSLSKPISINKIPVGSSVKVVLKI